MKSKLLFTFLFNSFKAYIKGTINKIPLRQSNNNFHTCNDTSIREEFSILSQNIDYNKFYLSYLNSDISKLNRYPDIRPYAFNQIKIRSNTKYINASSININKDKYFIATQGPLKSTIEDFWALIDENNVNVIVMLCNEIENNSEKCANYWDERNKMEKYKISKVKAVGNAKIPQYIIREIKLFNNLTKKESIVKQIHFVAWPDHGVPDIKEGKIFLIFDEMIKFADKNRNDNPIVVHCSAGVGRTGTFISMYCLYKEISKQYSENKREIKFSIFNLVRKLKEMRLYMVQTEVQYFFIYHYVYYLLTNYNK